MKAIFQTGYGSPDHFELRNTGQPDIKPKEVLVKVHAAAINAGDVYTMRGRPYMVRFVAGWPKPKNYIPGFDFAGSVVRAGSAESAYREGDEVFGSQAGSFAEFVGVKEKNLSAKPKSLDFHEAAAVPTAAVTALIGIRDAAKVKEGQHVLINGASGGVGTFAVQIAKALGAEVTGVCSTRNLDLVRSIGADHIIDYSQTDFTRGSQKYDVILDQVANHSLSAVRRVLTPGGIHIPNSGNGGLAYIIQASFASLIHRQQGRSFYASPGDEDLSYLTRLIEAGKIRPVMDRSYPLGDASEAFRYMHEVHPSGKVLISME